MVQMKSIVILNYEILDLWMLKNTLNINIIIKYFVIIK